jgi:molybdopterin/thiamine biosynthesis adenylyltransferase
MLQRQELTRQIDLIPLPALEERVTIIGAGATGSNITEYLCRMGMKNITVYDFDNVDIENMNNQCYGLQDIGKPKVEALKERINKLLDINIIAKNEKYEGGTFSGIVICALDSMEGRKLLWDNHKDNPYCKVFIDPRMAAEYGLVYVARPTVPDSMEEYAKTLHTDKEAVQEACTAKSTIYCATMLSGTVVKVVKDVITGNKYPKSIMWSIKDWDQICFF